jgi:CubicO group peptidase (beta-lactamase class C family)
MLGCVLAVLCASGSAQAEPVAASGIASELARGGHAGIESFILKVKGDVVERHVPPKLDTRPPDLRSATKSITALLVGIALDRGEIASVRANVADFLPPDYRAALAVDAQKSRITVEDLLTMRSGLACDDWNEKSPGHEDKMYRKRDWVEFWASQPMSSAPGERFSYCTGNVIALGVVLEEATRVPVDQYAAKHLFEPLGITRANWERWNRDKRIDTGGHLRLSPDDLLKIGELVLHLGKAGERQLVSSQWIEAMTSVHTDIPGRTQQYGYLWWLDRTKLPSLPQTRLWWAQGNGGNLLIVLPEIETVLVTTGIRFNRPEALEPMFWLRDRILPAIRASAGATAVTNP